MSRKKKATKNRRHSRRHVLDVKLRASQRRRAWIRTVALILLVSSTVVLGGYGVMRGTRYVLYRFVYTNDAFAIDAPEIRTDGIISEAQLQHWAGVKKGDNLLALNLRRVKRDLELVPAIREAVVERVFPRTLRIRVSEREPVAQVRFVGPAGEWHTYLLDRDGYAMFPLKPSQLARPMPVATARLPYLVGVNSARLRPGRRLEGDQILAALRLAAAFQASPMASLTGLREVDVQERGILRGRTTDRCEVVFGLDAFTAQMARWRRIYDWGRTQGQRLTSLDLSVTNYVPVRLMEGEVRRVTDAPRATVDREGRRNV